MKDQHFNFLELSAIFLAIKHFKTRLAGRWVTICSLYTASLTYIRDQGGSQSENLSLLAGEIPKWTVINVIQVTVEFFLGKLNAMANQFSRKRQIISTEWNFFSAN